MHLAVSLVGIALLSITVAFAQGRENPELGTSAVLNALVEPLKGFSGYYISVDDGALRMRGATRDPAAYLRAVQRVPLLSDARLTLPETASAPTDEERLFALTASISGYPAGGARPDAADPGAASAREISAATDKIFKTARCAHVSELAVPPGRVMFRWRCPADLRGVADLVAELETALGGLEVHEFAVFESGLPRESSSMDIKFSVRTGPQG